MSKLRNQSDLLHQCPSSFQQTPTPSTVQAPSPLALAPASTKRIAASMTTVSRTSMESGLFLAAETKGNNNQKNHLRTSSTCRKLPLATNMAKMAIPIETPLRQGPTPGLEEKTEVFGSSLAESMVFVSNNNRWCLFAACQ